MSQGAGAGWFQDPSDPGLLRYWDGSGWTHHTRPVSGPTLQTAAPPPAAAPRRSRRGLVAGLIAAGAVVVLVVAVVVAWGPVTTALFPKHSLADSSEYQRAEKYLLGIFTNRDDSGPLGFPGSDLSANRLSTGYATAAQAYVDDFVEQYDAENQLFDSELAAESFAHDNTAPEFAALQAQIEAGGAGLPFGDTSYPQDPAIVAIEQQIASTPVQPGPNGDYWDTARAVAALVEAEVTEDESLSDCIGLNPDEVAYFCPSQENWNRVFVTPLGSAKASSTGLVSTIKHEIAHKLILAQCMGSYLQSDWGSSYGEGVTNSYAVLFLGANPDELSSRGAYAMTDATYAKAQAIHDSDLACFDGDQLPAVP